MTNKQIRYRLRDTSVLLAAIVFVVAMATGYHGTAFASVVYLFGVAE